MTDTDNSWPVDLPSCIAIEKQGPTALLTLNRPEKRNALSDELVLGLQNFFTNIPEDIKAVVLRGAGDHFCAGLDLSQLREPTGVSFDRSGIGQGLNNTIQFCKVPVITVLHGAVVGGGLEIAAASHIRVAEKSAFFALPEGTRGLFLGSGGSVRLPRLIGAAAVMDMMLSGRVYDAEEAYTRLRLPQYLTDDGGGLEKGMEIAGKIASNSKLSNYAITQALPRISEIDPNTGLFTEMLMAAIAENDDDTKKRLREFLDLKMNKVKKS
ncbi:MAG: crotonase/enoyl-CoA hydratase family protein [Pseudomonadota bacterium]